MSKITYAVETPKQLKEEIQPLFDKHWAEIAMFPDKIKLDVNWEKYYELQEIGVLRAFTARCDGKLIGYSVFFVLPHIHYQKDVFAMNDILYIDPDYRKGRNGVGLILYSEKKLKEEGVSVIKIDTKFSNKVGELCSLMGYTKAEVSYMKYVGD